MSGAREAPDRQSVDAEGCRPDRLHLRQCGQHLSGRVAQERLDLGLDGVDVLDQAAPATDVAPQALGAQHRVGRRRQAVTPAPCPEAGVDPCQAARGTRDQ